MKLLNERAQVRTVAARWRLQYGAGSYHFDTRKRMAGGELAALGAETATAVEVAEIVGHGSWVEKKTCDECGARTWDAVEVGQPPDYESSTATICKNCLSAALGLLGADCSVQALDDAQLVQSADEALRKDAERYRWLRDNGFLDRLVGDLHPCDESRRVELTDKQVDAIAGLYAHPAEGDAAMKPATEPT